MKLPSPTLAQVLDLRDPRGLGGTALARVRAHHAAKTMLERVGANAVLAFAVGAEFPDPMRTAIRKALAEIGDMQHRINVHNAIDHVLRTGHAAGLWQHDGLGVLAQHALAFSRIEVDDESQVELAIAWRERLAGYLPTLLVNGDPVVVHGALLLALVLFDALLAPPLLEALTDPARASTEGAYLTLLHRHGLRRGDTDLRCRRWKVGALTEGLLAHWQQRRGDGNHVINNDAALAAAREALSEPGLPATQRALLQPARAFWRRYLSPVLYDLASDADRCESLPDSAFDRVLGRRGTTRTPWLGRGLQGSGVQFHSGTPHLDQRLQLRALTALRRCLRGLPQDARFAHGVLRERLAGWFDAHGEIGGWMVVLAYWVEHATGQARRDTRGKALRPGSVQRYLGSFATWLVQLASDLDPTAVDENALMARLEALRELRPDRSAEITQIALQEFLVFAERFGAPAIDLVDWWGLPPRGGTPNANVLTYTEYGRVLARLSRLYREQPECYDHRRLRTIFHLAFWAGLRWGELAWLPVDAIRRLGHGAFAEAMLLVRISKTVNGERALPLQCLLPNDALQEVLQYDADVRGGHFCQRPEGSLFFGEPLDPRVPPERWLHDLLQRLMRQVSGDESLVFHHLRHGAAGMLALRLFAPDVVLPTTLQGAAAAAFALPPHTLNYAHALTHRTLPHHHSAAIGALLGHLDGAVATCHYLHVAEWLLHDATRRSLPRVSDTVMAQLLNVQPATVRQRRWRSKPSS